MSATTVIILSIVGALLAASAGGFAWIQLHGRQLRAAGADAPRPRRRPF